MVSLVQRNVRPWERSQTEAVVGKVRMPLGLISRVVVVENHCILLLCYALHGFCSRTPIMSQLKTFFMITYSVSASQ